jgi:hypothetical protein
MLIIPKKLLLMTFGAIKNIYSLRIYSNMQYILYLRNEFSSNSFSSNRRLALWAVALEQGKASFFRGIQGVILIKYYSIGQ